MDNRLTEFFEVHEHLCIDHAKVDPCVGRGYCLCECGARRPIDPVGPWAKPDELPKALVLRLNSTMAIALNMLCACAGEFASGEIATAHAIACSLNRIGLEHPEDTRKLKAAVAALIDQIPREIVARHGLQVMSTNELRYKVNDG